MQAEIGRLQALGQQIEYMHRAKGDPMDEGIEDVEGNGLGPVDAVLVFANEGAGHQRITRELLMRYQSFNLSRVFSRPCADKYRKNCLT